MLSESPIKRLQQIQGEVVPRCSVLAVWKPAKVAGKKRNAGDRTGAIRAITAVSCGRRAAVEKQDIGSVRANVDEHIISSYVLKECLAR